MKKFFGVLLSIVLILTACHRQPSYEELLQRSQALIEEGHYHQALRLLKKAKRLRPNDEKVWYLLGEAALWSGRPYQALRYFETVVGLNPKHHKALVKLGYLYLVTGYYDKARHVAEEILKFDPQNVYARLILGNIKTFQGDLTKARKYFEEALAQNPKDFRCYLELGDFYLILRDYQKALSLYQRAQELAPKRPEVYIALGNYYMARQEWSKAEEAFKEALRYVPEKSDERRDYQAYLAEFYVEMGQGEKAFDLYKGLLKEEPTNYYFLVRYIEIALHLQRLEEAKVALQALSRYYPELFAVPYLRGHLFLSEGRYKDAIAAFQEALTRAEDPRAYYFLGVAQWLSGLYRQATSNLSRAVSKDPMLLKARLTLASLELATGEPSLAYKDLQLILPYTSEAHVLALVSRLKLKDCEEATWEWRFLKKITLPSQEKRLLELLWSSNCGPSRVPKRERLPLVAWVLFRERPSQIPNRIAGPKDVLKALELSLYAEQGDWARVEKALAPIDSQEPSLSYIKAVALARNGNYNGAILLLERVVATLPEFVPAQALLGELYLKAGAYDQAAEAFRKALVYAPQDPALLNNLAWALLKMPQEKGNLEEALRVAERAQDLAPEDPAVVDTLALVYHLSGMREVACRIIRRAHELAPKDRLIAQHQKMLCPQKRPPVHNVPQQKTDSIKKAVFSSPLLDTDAEKRP